MRIEIPFNPEMRKAIREGRKSETRRYRRYGDLGDVFDLDGEPYVLESVKREPLSDACWAREGFDSPDAFRRLWVKLHHRRGWRPGEKVWVHRFAALNAGSAPAAEQLTLT